MTPKKKLLMGCGFILITLFVIFITTIIILAASIFDKESKLEQNWHCDVNDCIKLQKEVSDIAMTFFKKIPPDQLGDITFNETQVNTIIFIALNRDNLTELFTDPDALIKKTKKEFYLYFKENKFHINYTLKIPCGTPFGSYINGTAEFIPIINSKEKTLKVIIAKVGSISLPNSIISIIEENLLKQINNKEENIDALKVISEIKIADNKLTAIYKTAALRDLIMTLSKKAFSD